MFSLQVIGKLLYERVLKSGPVFATLAAEPASIMLILIADKTNIIKDLQLVYSTLL